MPSYFLFHRYTHQIKRYRNNNNAIFYRIVFRLFAVDIAEVEGFADPGQIVADRLPAVTVNVAEMTENINLVLKYMGFNAIEENYSVAEYLKALIGGNYTNETKFLALELLNYGAAAQIYFGYNTDNLANTDYEMAPSNAVPESVPGVDVTGSVEGIRFYGTSVRFLSKTAVRFYFIADSIEGLSFTVDGTAYTPASNENGYYIEVAGINPQDMETELNVSVTNGSETLTVNYAPIYYFIRMYHNSNDEAMKNLL